MAGRGSGGRGGADGGRGPGDGGRGRAGRSGRGGGAPPEAGIREAIDALLDARRPGATICPSEAARAVADAGSDDAWRDLMPRVREVADAEADAGRLVVTQRGTVVRAGTARGPVRLGRPG